MNVKPWLGVVALALFTASVHAQEIPQLVKNINTSGSSLVEDHEAVEFNGLVYFAAQNDVNGIELWVTDGTEDGTQMVKDINPGGDSSPRDLTVVGDVFFFSAIDGLTGRELWKSDGTNAGTVLVSDIIFGPDDADIEELTEFQGQLYFNAETPAEGRELWKSDGTDAGTVLLKDILPGGDGSAPTGLTALDDVFVFAAEEGANGNELWRSDGTTVGTVIVKDIEPGAIGSFPFALTRVGNGVYFAADTFDEDIEPWRTDGTNEGTQMVADLNSLGDSSPHDFALLGNTVYFVAFDGDADKLFKTDGTPGGTALVRDLSDGDDPIHIGGLVVAGNLLFFSAQDADDDFGEELWKSDGTAGGTVMVRDIEPGVGSSFPERLIAVGDKLFFVAETTDESDEPWISDGTRDGTRILADLDVGEGSSNPDPLLASQGRVFFSADEDTGLNEELYVVALHPPTLINIATRAFVGQGERVLIAGFIIGGSPKLVLIRAIGPSLANFGINTPLNNPQVQIFSGQSQIAFNDNWRSTQEAEIMATGLAPSHDNESAILIQLNPGPFTAIVSGVSGGTGVGLVEVFEIEPSEAEADAAPPAPDTF